MRFKDWDEFMASMRAPSGRSDNVSGLLKKVEDFVAEERRAHEEQDIVYRNLVGPEPEVYPAPADVFRFTTIPLRQVKVVIIGQDPYHGPGQADGLAFSVREGVKVPPSLRNIFEEWRSDTGFIRPRVGGLVGASLQTVCERPINGDLTPWTRQGVLLLNTALTVRQGEPGSHLTQWQPFTDEVVRAVVDSADIAPHFVLWGAKARATFERCVGQLNADHKGWTGLNCPKCKGSGETDNARACPDCAGTGELNTQDFRTVKVPDRLLTCTYSPHPSPLSANRDFFRSRPFSQANLALRLNNGEGCVVDWRLP